MQKIKISQGWYRSAGIKFGWVKDGFDVRGVGISAPPLKQNREIEIQIEGNDYILNCQEALDFIKRYNALQTMRSTKLGIVSRSLLKPCLAPESKEIPTIEKTVEFVPPTLF